MRFTHTQEMRYKNYEERASWTPRFLMCTVVSNEGLVTITGGQTDGTGADAFSNEVWQLESPQGDSQAWYLRKTNDDRLNLARQPLEWKRESEPPWTPRRGHQAFIDDEGIPYILGGEDATGMKNDMWKMESSMDVGNLQSAYERTRSQATEVATEAGQESEADIP